MPLGKEKDLLTLDQIIDSSQRLIGYVEGISKSDLEKDVQLQDSIIRRIEIIGEAVKRLSMSLRNRYNHVPWKQIAGMKDILLHEYDRIDIDTVWNVATDKIYILLDDVIKIREEENE